MPVITTVPLDGAIQNNNLGRVVNSVSEIVTGLRTFAKNPIEWRICSRAARAYYENNHTVEAVALKYDRLFTTLTAGVTAERRQQKEPVLCVE
jgi:hypothetical protein